MFLIKRVVGLPGHTVSSTNDAVTIDGNPLSEPWLPDGTAVQGPAIQQVTIPRGDYYVLGDNRGNSEDSRFFGPVPASSVVGQVETSKGKVCRP